MQMTIIERAFHHAEKGNCRSVRDVSDALKREQFSAVDAHLQGRQIKASLSRLIKRRLHPQVS